MYGLNKPFPANKFLENLFHPAGRCCIIEPAANLYLWGALWKEVFLPTQYENLIVGIDYTNYCFSMLLFGLSAMLIILGKRALALHKEVIYFYYFLTVVWLFRACLATFIEPWPLEPIPAAAVGQLAASDSLAILMIFVDICFIKEINRNWPHANPLFSTRNACSI